MSIVLNKIIDPSLEKMGDRTRAEVQAELTAFAEKQSRELLLDFELTTAFWDHPVKFERLVEVSTKEITIIVGTDDEIYGYVNYGTKPHIIPKAILPYPLAFKTGGKAKTTPGKIPSGKGAKGTKPVFARRVHHPGTKARNFDGLIQKKYEKTFMNMAQKALDHAIKRAGLE